eukprot:Awhi_evm1s5921
MTEFNRVKSKVVANFLTYFLGWIFCNLLIVILKPSKPSSSNGVGIVIVLFQNPVVMKTWFEILDGDGLKNFTYPCPMNV